MLVRPSPYWTPRPRCRRRLLAAIDKVIHASRQQPIKDTGRQRRRQQGGNSPYDIYALRGRRPTHQTDGEKSPRIQPEQFGLGEIVSRARLETHLSLKPGEGRIGGGGARSSSSPAKAPNTNGKCQMELGEFFVFKERRRRRERKEAHLKILRELPGKTGRIRPAPEKERASSLHYFLDGKEVLNVQPPRESKQVRPSAAATFAFLSLGSVRPHAWLSFSLLLPSSVKTFLICTEKQSAARPVISDHERPFLPGQSLGPLSGRACHHGPRADKRNNNNMRDARWGIFHKVFAKTTPENNFFAPLNSEKAGGRVAKLKNRNFGAEFSVFLK
jgi:hypothetical protein